VAIFNFIAQQILTSERLALSSSFSFTFLIQQKYTLWSSFSQRN